MGRWTSSLIVGSIVAAFAGWMFSRNRRGHNMNNMLNSMINMMGSLGIFRLMGRSGLMNRMARFR